MPATEVVAQLVQSRKRLVVAQPTWEAGANFGIDVACQAKCPGELGSADARKRGVSGIQRMLLKLRFV